jgi:hypothetical protein
LLRQRGLRVRVADGHPQEQKAVRRSAAGTGQRDLGRDAAAHISAQAIGPGLAGGSGRDETNLVELHLGGHTGMVAARCSPVIRP